ncbi:hypothetical protein TNCV_940311 [Trichonephila clavipes]|nr:hypothetical protein TNCV_940311 [Trichonephila clavipes]
MTPSSAWRDKGTTPCSACRWNGIRDGGLVVSNLYGIVRGLEQIDVFMFSSPYGTFSDEGLQWMTSSKDWKELMSSGSPDGTILLIRYCEFFLCCAFERGED